MNKIEKLYENAELSNMWVEKYDDKQIWHKSYNKMIESMMKVNDWSRKVAIEVAKKECRKALPPFTAEKQLELIKWLSRRYIEISNYDAENGRMYNIKPTVGDFATSFNYDFSECIAGCINQLWQDLTKEEKEQIRSVLK